MSGSSSAIRTRGLTLTAHASRSKRLDRSFQTAARAEPARPEGDTASGVSRGDILADALRFPDGKPDAHRRARAFRALDLDAAVVALDDRLHDRQAEAGARDRPLGRFATAEEAVEEERLLLRRDADSRVDDFDQRVAVPRRDPDVDPSAFGGEFQGIGHQVVEHLGQAAAIADHFRGGGQRRSELDALLVGNRLRRFDGLGDDVVEVDLAELERELPGLDLSEEEEVADEVHEALRVAVDDGEETVLVVAQLTRAAVEEQLEVAADRGQRGPELMRDQRDELVLQPVELTKPLVLFGQGPLRGLGVGSGDPLLRKQVLKLRLLPLRLRDVPGDHSGGGYPPQRVANGRGRQRDVHFGAVLAQTPRLVLLDTLTLHQAARDGPELVLPVGRHERGHGPSNHLLGRVAEQPLRPYIPAQDLAAGRHARNGVVRGFDDRCELNHGLFGAAALREGILQLARLGHQLPVAFVELGGGAPQDGDQRSPEREQGDEEDDRGVAERLDDLNVDRAVVLCQRQGADRTAAGDESHGHEGPEHLRLTQELFRATRPAAEHTLEAVARAGGADQRVVGRVGHPAGAAEQRCADEAPDNNVVEDRVECLPTLRLDGTCEVLATEMALERHLRDLLRLSHGALLGPRLDVALEHPEHRDRDDDERDAGVHGKAQGKPRRLCSRERGPRWIGDGCDQHQASLLSGIEAETVSPPYNSVDGDHRGPVYGRERDRRVAPRALRSGCRARGRAFFDDLRARGRPAVYRRIGRDR